MKSNLLVFAALVILGGIVSGCGTNEQAVETVPVKTEAKNDPAVDPIQGNPNIPQAAKDAMSGGKK